MRAVLTLGLLTALVLLSTVALAQTGGGYDLTWNTVDGGGHTFSIRAGYTLGGTVGQPDAGQLSGGAFTLGGGFWGGGAEATPFAVYLPLTLRGK